jgi:hypothetical protein
MPKEKMMISDDDTPTMTLTIMVGSGGGFVVYDVSNSVSKLAFGGNLDETTAYLHSIMDNMRVEPAEPVSTTMPAPRPAAFRKSPYSVAKLADRLLDEEH